MIIDAMTPGSTGLRVWFNGKLIGGVIRVCPDEGWVEAYVVREVAGQRTWTTEVERCYGCVDFVERRA